MNLKSLCPLFLLALVAVCDPAQAQNSPATGMPAVTYVGSITAPTEDSAITAAQGTIADTDGLGTLSWQWSAATANGGTYTAIAMATNAAFTPLQAHVGMFLQVCASFMDMASTPNEEERCLQIATAVANVNDAPVAQNNTIYVPVGGSYTFSADDFPFTDEDGHALFRIVIGSSVPAAGAFSLSGTTVSPSLSIPPARLDARLLTYTPPADATAAMAGYASFNFTVRTGGSVFNVKSSATRTMTIDLVPTTPSAATGAPTVTAATGTAHNEDVELTAAIGTVADTNGIPTHTRTWQWQSAPAPATGTPAASAYTDIAGATAVTFTPMQAHVGLYIRVCLSFTDGTGTAEMRCSAGTIITNVNDAPVAAENPPAYTATNMPGSADTVVIHPAAFQAAYTDPDGDLDMLAAVNITTLPADGSLRLGGTAVTTGQAITITANEFMGGLLTFTPTDAATESTTLGFSLTDSGTPAITSNTATITINLQLGQDIDPGEVVAVFNAAAAAAAADAIMGAISASPTSNAFDLSLDGTSLAGAARTLSQSAAAEQNPWYHSTTAEWEYHAAYNAGDDSADSLLHRLQSMADGDIAMNWQAGGSAMRFWARYQSVDLSGNEGETLEYDGSGSGFYIGADRQINERMRLGLAISSDSADISLDLDDDTMDDEATRSATTIYPYMQMDLGNNNHLRLIAGIGSGDLDIKSSANDSTASAALSWNMLAASIRHHRQMRGNLSARFNGSLQLANTSTDAATFTGGAASVAAADASTNELAIDAQLRYRRDNFTPFASITARKLGGDLSQSMALDLGLGADLQTNAAIIRLGLTRQLNDTDHKRDSLSLDIATNPNPGGLSASLGSRYDGLSGRPQWQGTVRWQRLTHELSLAASQSDLRLQARLRW